MISSSSSNGSSSSRKCQIVHRFRPIAPKPWPITNTDQPPPSTSSRKRFPSINSLAIAGSSSKKRFRIIKPSSSDSPAVPDDQMRVRNSEFSTVSTDLSLGLSSSSCDHHRHKKQSATDSDVDHDQMVLLKLAYSSCSQPVALADELNQLMWCNPAFSSVASSGRVDNLGTPVQVFSFVLGNHSVIVWTFFRKDFIQEGGSIFPLLLDAENK